MRRLVLTGGGTAGHVTPHFALLPHLQKKGWELHYIGTADGIERELVTGLMPYYPISAGKFRRYFALKNLSDPFKVVLGIFQARRLLKQLRPALVFSKGGFVTVPVTIAAWSLGIPVILHESDLTPGLANRLSLPFAKELCLTFPDSLAFIKRKAIVTGTPVRPELFRGSPRRGLELCHFSEHYPTLLVMGGSLGAVALNRVIRENLESLSSKYQIIHLCGRGNLDEQIKNRRYVQFEYVRAELADLLAAADYVISRAGANSIFELAALAKPHLLVPLSRQASRGDQILNAESFAKQGFSVVIPEEQLNDQSLQRGLALLESDAERFVQAMRAAGIADGTNKVLSVLERWQ